MDVAQVIIQLAAHKEVVDAELQRIDADIDFLRTAKAKYEPAATTANTSRLHNSSRVSSASVGNNTTARGGGNFSGPLAGLTKLRKEKAALSEEIRRQLDLFQLHHKSGAALLQKINKAQNSSSAPIEIGGGSATLPVAINF